MNFLILIKEKDIKQKAYFLSKKNWGLSDKQNYYIAKYLLEELKINENYYNKIINYLFRKNKSLFEIKIFSYSLIIRKDIA